MLNFFIKTLKKLMSIASDKNTEFSILQILEIKMIYMQIRYTG